LTTPIDPKYLRDWSGLALGTPAELHRPHDTAEVAALVRRCNDQGLKVTVQGGLTGLAGGAVPAEGDVVLNMERMNAIEQVDELEGITIVQAGATLEQVQAAADRAGWYFPVDLGARGSCQVGGNAATNAGGDRVLRYGTMRDAVLGLETMLADGTRRTRCALRALRKACNFCDVVRIMKPRNTAARPRNQLRLSPQFYIPPSTQLRFDAKSRATSASLTPSRTPPKGPPRPPRSQPKPQAPRSPPGPAAAPSSP